MVWNKICPQKEGKAIIEQRFRLHMPLIVENL
jgi:hypothetical protein